MSVLMSMLGKTCKPRESSAITKVNTSGYWDDGAPAELGEADGVGVEEDPEPSDVLVP
jgi:hypothetical protein